MYFFSLAASDVLTKHCGLRAGLLSSNAVRHYLSAEKMFASATAFCRNATCSLIGRKPTVCIFGGISNSTERHIPKECRLGR